MTTTPPLNERFHTLRLDQGIEQRHLAAAIGVTAGALRNWERGTKQPRIHYAIALTEALAHQLVVRLGRVVICDVLHLLPNLAGFREAHDLTRAQLAGRLYMTPERIGVIERCIDLGISIGLDTLQRYLTGLGDYVVDAVPAERGDASQAQPVRLRFRVVRRSLRLRQQDVADMLGVCLASINNWERGHKSPSVEDANAWAHTLHHRLVVMLNGAVVGDLLELVPNLAGFRQAQGASQQDVARGMWRTRHAVYGTERRIEAGDAIRLATVELYLGGLGCQVGLVPARALERAA